MLIKPKAYPTKSQWLAAVEESSSLLFSGQCCFERKGDIHWLSSKATWWNEK